MERVFVIAEAGVNHNGCIDTAKRMIDAASAAGCDAVKFQTFKSDKVVTSTADKARYQIENTGNKGSQLEMLKKLEMSVSAHNDLYSYCQERGILFLSTPFDEESADLLDKLGMSIFKIPSGEITNKPFIKHIASKNKPIILSTGMSYLGEIEKAVGWINEAWSNLNKKPWLILLHCVSNYPAESDINLSSLKTMGTAFGLQVGYSDHTIGIEIAIAAVAMGAKVIEKHFTLDKNMAGPDHKASLNPDELTTMVKAFRNVEKSIGNGIKKPTKSEEDTRSIVRRSLVAAKDIKAGDIITSDFIAIKRPATGIPPEFKDVIVGMQARKDIGFDSVIKWDDFKHA